ncbi:hypothetical protein E2C01_095334 [Portunus trituberculatus]|uniref:Uncharacterized protein n=1 Tax=Portunus trituberculatus TaxID=210409 RepID=A0A5B7JYG1_PORTR|nr:hypothetical protein [Portunus trituberculatus]
MEWQEVYQKDENERKYFVGTGTATGRDGTGRDGTAYDGMGYGGTGGDRVTQSFLYSRWLVKLKNKDELNEEMMENYLRSKK